ncbi:putative golgin subfamily A member 6-like protein 6 [Poecilia latipinna]|uniref:uncharacterized protein LOC107835200 n=1 Tax=Poecilia formosa TaxID=48698 RepID=UPI00072E2F66|nr:PREDICTED: putative golgin subfamily A member 6-like protein 6 [Poecilia latipinna]XP_016523015.1 PREDICTED: uncharacterized protein LOC107835200 [Poecilia formosa]
MAQEEVAKMLHEAQHQEKKTPKQKPLADELAARYQYKQKQKRETDRTERQGVLPGYRAEEIGARRQKKDPQQKLNTQDKTEPNMEDQKKTVDDNLEDILRKEAPSDSLLQKSYVTIWPKEEVAKMLREAHHQEKKTPKQKPLADELAARYQYKQKQKREMDRTERQGVLPGYRAEENRTRRQKKDPQQKLNTQDETKKHMDNPDAMQWEMHHSVTVQGRDVQYESGFLDHESDCDIPDKDRSCEIRKK